MSDRVSLSMQVSTDASSPQVATAGMLRSTIDNASRLGISDQSKRSLEDSLASAHKGKLSASSIGRLLVYCKDKGATIPNDSAVFQEAMAAATMGNLGSQMPSLPKQLAQQLQQAAAAMTQAPEDIVHVAVHRGDSAKQLRKEFKIR